MTEAVKRTKTRKQRRTVTGVVTTARKSPQTIQVTVEYRVRHTHYNKFVRRRTKLAAHDPEQTANVGDRVEVVECRPISKTKRWRLVKVLVAAPTDQV